MQHPFNYSSSNVNELWVSATLKPKVVIPVAIDFFLTFLECVYSLHPPLLLPTHVNFLPPLPSFL